MKKINRKGFTLIELLATIAIIGLVIGLSTFGIIEVVNNSKTKAKDISMDSIKKSARIYSEEASSTDWKDITDKDYKYFCVTIQELINKGLIKEEDINKLEEYNITKTNYVVVTKNKVTEVIEKEEILKTNNTSNICTNSNDILEKYYTCTYDKNNYDTLEKATAACTVTDIKDKEIVESTTYSCPAGYTCSDGTCTSSSTCEKTVTGEISKMYYCSHNKSYQTSSECSYTGWENAAFDLGCSTTQTCSASTYSCPSGSTLSGTNCYMYNRYSCRDGWTAVKTGYCEYSCGKSNGLLYSHCSGVGTCKSNSAYSCVSTCGSNDSKDCRPNVTLYGSNYPYTSCKTTNTIYNCYTPATETKNCVTTGQYYAGNYRGCRLVGSDEVANGFSCSSGNTGNYNDVGTSSCSVSGYTLTKVLDGDCPDELKFDKDGTKYCDTANGYWKGKSCTSGYQFGASAIYKLTCSKTGSLRYYCDVTDTYSTSQPSSCSKKVSEDVISTVVTNYVCPTGYSPSDNDDTCYKTVVYEVQ